MINQKLSEYHTGFRAYSAEVLKTINYNANSDGFVFDNEIIAQAFYLGYEIAEITCPTVYKKNSSSISFKNSIIYGFGVVVTSCKYLLQKLKIANFKLFYIEVNKTQ